MMNSSVISRSRVELRWGGSTLFTARSWLSISTALCCSLSLPFIQLGKSYYVSVAVWVFAALLLLCSMRSLTAVATIVLVGITGFILKGVLNVFVTKSVFEVLLPLREAICFVGIIVIAESIRRETNDGERMLRKAFIVLCGLMVAVSVQALAIARGSYVGFPVSWFVMNQNTLVGLELALEHGTRARPTAFYGEPSYAAFVAICLFGVMFKASAGYMMRSVGFLMAFTVAVVSGSMSGVLGTLLFGFVAFCADTMNSRRIWFLVVVSGVAVLAISVSLVTSSELSSRASAILAGEDASAGTRLSVPMDVLFDSVMDGNLGGANRHYIESKMGTTQIDNAAIRLMIYYGVLLIFPATALALYIRDIPTLILLLVCTQFNGEIFSYDKAIVIGFALGGMLCCNSRLGSGDTNARRERFS